MLCCLVFYALFRNKWHVAFETPSSTAASEIPSIFVVICLFLNILSPPPLSFPICSKVILCRGVHVRLSVQYVESSPIRQYC